MRPSRQIPADFAERAMKETILSMRMHYQVSPNTVRQWIAKLGLERPNLQKSAGQHAMPEGFAEYQAGRSVLLLCEHYGRNKAVIRRWLGELNICRAKARAKPGRPKGSVAKAIVVPVRRVHPITAPLDRVQRDMSGAGQAADFLRRFGPVYRCDVRGRPLSDGFFWRRGSAVMTDNELIERADWMREREAA